MDLSTLTSFVLSELKLLTIYDIITLSVSGAIAILSRNKWTRLKSDYDSINKTQIVSLDKLSKSKNIGQDSENVVLSGKFNSYSYYNQKFYISTLNYTKRSLIRDLFHQKLIRVYCQDVKSIYTERLGIKEKFFHSRNVFSNFIHKIYCNHLDLENRDKKEINMKNYFNNHDIIGVFCKKDRLVETSFANLEQFTPSIIFQGNKLTVLKRMEGELQKLDHISNCFTFCFVINGISSRLFKWLKTKISEYCSNIEDMRSDRPFVTTGENCSKCRVNIANVIFTDCNHFMLCNSCFHRENKMCRICNGKQSDYIVLKHTK